MPTHIERVVSLGDSQSLGLGTKDRHGWVQMLRQRYYELNYDQGETPRCPRVFHELGIHGVKASHLVTAVTHEVPPRFRLPAKAEKEYDRTKRLSIVAIGTNDSGVHPNTKEPVTPIDQFTKRMDYAATKLAEQGEVIFVGFFPTDTELYSTYWGIDVHPQQEARVKYEEKAIERFSKVGAHVIPLVQKAFDSPEYMANLTDGIHGNAQVEQWIYNQVTPTFEAVVTGQ